MKKKSDVLAVLPGARPLADNRYIQLNRTAEREGESAADQAPLKAAAWRQKTRQQQTDSISLLRRLLRSVQTN
jgi:hypothetical protein